MRKLILLAAAGTACAGCTQGDTEIDAETNLEASVPVDSTSGATMEYQDTAAGSTISGKTAYEMFCSTCHDSPVSGAPLTGDRNAWEERSPMWEAVLAEHARTGYMDMPARGGSSALSDQDVTRAVEYMMSLTYPELPPD